MKRVFILLMIIIIIGCIAYEIIYLKQRKFNVLSKLETDKASLDAELIQINAKGAEWQQNLQDVQTAQYAGKVSKQKKNLKTAQTLSTISKVTSVVATAISWVPVVGQIAIGVAAVGQATTTANLNNQIKKSESLENEVVPNMMYRKKN